MIKRFLLVGSAIIFLIVFTATFVLWLGAHRYRQEQREWIAMGGTLDPTEFQPAPVPDDENAAVLYEKAYDLYMNAMTEEEYDIIASDFEADADAAAQVFAKHEELIDILRRAASMEQCVWDMGFSEGAFDRLSSGDSILGGPDRDFAVILAGHAVHAHRQGDHETALSDLEATLRMARHMAQDPTLLSILQVIAIEHLVTNRYEAIFAEVPAPDDRIIRIFESIDYRERWRAALMGEALLSMVTTEEIMEDEVPGVLRPIAAGVAGWDGAYYLSNMRSLVQRAERPYYESPIEYEKEELPFYAMQSLSLVAIARSAKSCALMDTRAQMLITAERLREYKRAHGIYPEPGEFEMPIDPATGKRIAYERTGDGEGFTLRSEATRGRDDEPVTWQWSR